MSHLSPTSAMYFGALVAITVLASLNAVTSVRHSLGGEPLPRPKKVDTVSGRVIALLVDVVVFGSYWLVLSRAWATR